MAVLKSKFCSFATFMASHDESCIFPLQIPSQNNLHLPESVFVRASRIACEWRASYYNIGNPSHKKLNNMSQRIGIKDGAERVCEDQWCAEELLSGDKKLLAGSKIS